MRFNPKMIGVVIRKNLNSLTFRLILTPIFKPDLIVIVYFLENIVRDIKSEITNQKWLLFDILMSR